MKISVSVALNTKGPSAKSKEKLKLARAAFKHLAKVGMGSRQSNCSQHGMSHSKSCCVPRSENSNEIAH